AAAPDIDVGHILLADVNADMRDYARRLLSQRWTVDAVFNGREALAAARARPPDVIVADVMMPMLDGFGLLRELRADPDLRAIPVVMLSAPAGGKTPPRGVPPPRGRLSGQAILRARSARTRRRATAKVASPGH